MTKKEKTPEHRINFLKEHIKELRQQMNDYEDDKDTLDFIEQSIKLDKDRIEEIRKKCICK